MSEFYAPDHQEDIIPREIFIYGTDTQIKYADAVNKHGSHRKAAKVLGVNQTTISRAIKMMEKKAASKGVAPRHHMVHSTPDPFITKGVSTMYGADGEVKVQWHKTKIDDQLRLDMMKDIVAAQCEEIKPLRKTKSPIGTKSELMNVYTMTDCHMGMLAWGKEGGGDWDLKISENILSNAFRAMLDNSPASETCVVAQLGDWLHYDGLTAVTPTGGNILDADSRFQQLVEASVRTLRRLVGWALQKHKKVIVLMAEGNHDIASSVWLRAMFKALYENEPRVDVIDTPLPYYSIQHGVTMLGWHHGHLKKPDQVPLMFAAEFAEIWGKTEYRYIHMGDKHHLQMKDHSGCQVIQHPTLAARDAYSSRHGWHSFRSARAISYHAEFGEIFSNVVTPEMVADFTPVR